jgi:hypothetical protein
LPGLTRTRLTTSKKSDGAGVSLGLCFIAGDTAGF